MSMKGLGHLFGPQIPMSVRNDTAEIIYELDGVTTVLLSLNELTNKSLQFVELVVRFLIPVTLDITSCKTFL
jgi:hypothetical protein